jgi:hypothetical protein
MENQHLVSPPQCSSAPVGCGQEFLIKRTMWRHRSIPHTPPTWVHLIFTCSIVWNQHWRGGDVMNIDRIKNDTEQLKSYSQNGFQGCFQRLYSHRWKCTYAKGDYFEGNVAYMIVLFCTGLFEMNVGVITTCHTRYTWDSSICIFLFNRTTLQVFVTYLTGALYVHPLWFYKHQHDNRVRSKLFEACQPVHRCGKCWFKKFSDVSVEMEISWSIGATTYSCLKCIVYDKLLKPRQSFRTPLYFS